MGLSRPSVRALRPCPLHLEEMPEAVCPHFILKLLLRVSSCLCRCQAAPFPPASGNSSWKPVNGRDFLFVEGFASRSPARPPPGSAGGALGLLCLDCARFGTLGRREEEGFNFQSTTTPSPLSAWRQEMLRDQIGYTEDAGHAGFRPPVLLRDCWGDTVGQRVPALASVGQGGEEAGHELPGGYGAERS